MTAGGSASPTAAFFDVDHTVTLSSTLESFVTYFAGLPGTERVSEELPHLVAFAASSSNLREIHQRFAHLFRGLSWQAVLAAGQAWYQATPGLLRPSIVAEIRWHQSERREVVFVSGSWAPCLAPIAQQLGVHTVLCSEPALAADGDTLVGSFTDLMLGARKAEAAAATGFDLVSSYAYGDDPSDEPLLRSVGHSVAVGTGGDLVANALANGWRVVAS